MCSLAVPRGVVPGRSHSSFAGSRGHPRHLTELSANGRQHVWCVGVAIGWVLGVSLAGHAMCEFPAAVCSTGACCRGCPPTSPPSSRSAWIHRRCKPGCAKLGFTGLPRSSAAGHLVMSLALYPMFTDRKNASQGRDRVEAAQSLGSPHPGFWVAYDGAAWIARDDAGADGNPGHFGTMASSIRHLHHCITRLVQLFSLRQRRSGSI